MKLYNFYKCGTCGNVVPLAQVLVPPTNGQLAQPIPCVKCGDTNWQPVRAS